MIYKLNKINLAKLYQYLLILLAFLIPLTVAGANSIIVLIVLLWIFSGNYKSKFLRIKQSKLLLASIIFYGIHILGMLWTKDIAWGLEILHKMWYFLLFFPILYTLVKKEQIAYYVSAFLLAISITEVASYLVWFELIDPFKNATVANPTPFMSHISYNPILTLAIYIVLHKVLIDKTLTKLKYYSYSFFAFSMTINMFITGGRAGQVMFFAMLSILIFQHFDKQKIKAIITILVLIPSIFLSAYQFSDLFHTRVDKAITEIVNFSEIKNQNTSVGLRISFVINSWDIIKNNPIIGVGTGDFPSEYKKVNIINSPALMMTPNPHNMYILSLVQFGLIGLISLLSIFYYQIKLSFNANTKFIRDFGLALPLLFLVIMFSDSYLLGHYTTLVFVFFSSFLHNNFEKP